MSSMKAVRIHAYGSSEVLAYEDAPRPIPAEGEVLIRVHATSVNPFDIAVRAGYMSGYFNHSLPLILGTDISGEVAALGPNTNSFSPGQAVYARGGVTRDGAYGEYALVKTSETAHKPQNLDHFQAAALPHVTLTAWQALFELADLQPGQRVLIHGAAGGVGHVAVQLAKGRGAYVIGTASQNYDLLERLGVDQPIDYTKTAFEQAVQGVDVVLDTIGGETQKNSWATLKPGGMLVSVVEAPSAEVAERYGVRQAMVYSAPPVAETLTQAARLVEAGHLTPLVSDILPLADIRTAHQRVEGRHTRGKIVLQVAS